MIYPHKIFLESMAGGTTIHGCKLPRHLENPVDDLLMVLIDPLLAPLRQRGITPNDITVVSIVAAAASLYCCFRSHPFTAAVFWSLSYAADVADGMMARRYNMETELGGRLDHVSDVAAFCGLMAFAWSRLPSRPWWPLGVEAVLLAGAWYHLQCQEKGTPHLAFDGIDGRRCADKRHLAISRWLGTGTLTLWHLFLIFFYGRT